MQKYLKGRRVFKVYTVSIKRNTFLDIKQIKQELMDYTNGKIYFEKAW